MHTALSDEAMANDLAKRMSSEGVELSDLSDLDEDHLKVCTPCLPYRRHRPLSPSVKHATDSHTTSLGCSDPLAVANRCARPALYAAASPAAHVTDSTRSRDTKHTRSCFIGNYSKTYKTRESVRVQYAFAARTHPRIQRCQHQSKCLIDTILYFISFISLLNMDWLVVMLYTGCICDEAWSKNTIASVCEEPSLPPSACLRLQRIASPRRKTLSLHSD